jgi:hypothetical protein
MGGVIFRGFLVMFDQGSRQGLFLSLLLDGFVVCWTIAVGNSYTSGRLLCRGAGGLIFRSEGLVADGDRALAFAVKNVT